MIYFLQQWDKETWNYNRFSKFLSPIDCHAYRFNCKLELAENRSAARLKHWRSAFWWLEKNQLKNNGNSMKQIPTLVKIAGSIFAY